MDKSQGGLLGIGIGIFIVSMGGILNPDYEGGYKLMYILYLLEYPWIHIHNFIFPIDAMYADKDMFSLSEGIIFLFGPFLSIISYYYIGYYLTILYHSIQKK